jgi:hypothetical protein
MRWIVALGAVSLLSTAIGTTEVRAANPDFCRDYANAAVNQTRIAWDNWRCRRGAQPPRWMMNWQAHFNWCLGAPWEAARREREIRHEWLEQCRY